MLIKAKAERMDCDTQLGLGLYIYGIPGALHTCSKALRLNDNNPEEIIENLRALANWLESKLEK